MDPLPFELIDLIVSHLDRREDLKSCSLVSRAWCAPAQIYIFHTISAQNGVQCLRLHNVLLISPHTAEFIRFISFKIDDRVSAMLASAILRLLKSLRCVTMFNGTWTWPGDRPHELSAILREPIADILSQHPLTDLALLGFSLSNVDLQYLFIHAPSLKHLVLADFTSLPFDIRPPKQATARINLELLSMTLLPNNYLLGEWLCQPQCSIDLTHLHTLGVTYDPDYNGHCIGLISRILRFAGRSLKVLGIRRNKAEVALNGIPWNLSHHPSLRSLTLDLSPFVTYPTNRCPPMWVTSTLLNLPRPNLIEELVVYFMVQSCNRTTILCSDYRGWRYMASLLTSESFPSLQLVKFVITRPIQNPELFEDIAREKIKELGVKWTFRMFVEWR